MPTRLTWELLHHLSKKYPKEFTEEWQKKFPQQFSQKFEEIAKKKIQRNFWKKKMLNAQSKIFEFGLFDCKPMQDKLWVLVKK